MDYFKTHPEAKKFKKYLESASPIPHVQMALLGFLITHRANKELISEGKFPSAVGKDTQLSKHVFGCRLAKSLGISRSSFTRPEWADLYEALEEEFSHVVTYVDAVNEKKHDLLELIGNRLFTCVEEADTRFIILEAAQRAEKK